MVEKLSNINWRLVQFVVLLFALLIYSGIQGTNRAGEQPMVPVAGKTALLQQTETSPKNRLDMAAVFVGGSALRVVYSVAY
jgi:hypothetical protein